MSGGCCGLEVDGGVPPGSGSSAAGFTTITKVDISLLLGVQGAWDFEDNVNDRSANGYNLDFGVANVFYATFQGKRCAYRPPNATWRRTVNDVNLTITGALTCHHLVAVVRVPGSAAWYFGFANAAGTQPENDLYALTTANGSDGEKLQYHSENGAGVDSNYSFDIMPVYTWQLLTLTRNAAGTSVNLYVNGALSGNVPGAVTAPDGGTNSMFCMYNPASASGAAGSYVGDMVVQNVEMAAADILAVAQQVGVAPP